MRFFAGAGAGFDGAFGWAFAAGLAAAGAADLGAEPWLEAAGRAVLAAAAPARSEAELARATADPRCVPPIRES